MKRAEIIFRWQGSKPNPTNNFYHNFDPNFDPCHFESLSLLISTVVISKLSGKKFRTIQIAILRLAIEETKLQPGVNLINMLTRRFSELRSQKLQKDSQVISVEKKLTDLLCCCTSTNLHFTLCAQVWWNRPQLSSLLL